jgi:hypothetical protein
VPVTQKCSLCCQCVCEREKEREKEREQGSTGDKEIFFSAVGEREREHRRTYPALSGPASVISDMIWAGQHRLWHGLGWPVAGLVAGGGSR